jgi:hypothetical protein
MAMHNLSMIKLFLLALTISAPLFAQVTDTPAIVSEETVEKRKFNDKESHWLVAFGAQGMKYDTPYYFQGARTNFSPSSVELWGGRLSFGGQLHLGQGLVTTTLVEGYFLGTLFSRVLNGGPDDASVDFAYTKKTGQVYGFDAVQQLGYTFDMKTRNPFMGEWTYLTFQPFVEAGVGIANAYNRLNYSYDTGATPTSAREGYKHTVSDQLANMRVGAGVNITSREGYFFYLRAAINKYDLLNRESVIYTRPNGAPAGTVTKNTDKPSLDNITTYALGGGYKF